MLVLLTGVSCVGKTSVGSALAELLGVPFVDLDDEVERQLGAPIERLQQRFGSLEVFRDHAAKVLTKVLVALSGQRGATTRWRRLRGVTERYLILGRPGAGRGERLTARGRRDGRGWFRATAGRGAARGR